MRVPIAIFTVFLLLTTVSCEEILLEQDISSSNLELLAPRDSVVVRASSVFFNWSPVKGSTSYQIQIATPNFQQATQIVVDTQVEDNSFFLDLPKSNYEWRVRAVNSEYNTSFKSAFFSVEDTEYFSSDRVVLIAPEDNYITNNLNIDLEWREVEGATSYRLQILEENNLIKEETTASTNIIIEFPQGEFTWKVRAENETQNTFYSERSLLTDTLSPNIPKLIRPTNEATLSSETVNFEWERSDLGGSNETDSLFVYKDIGLEELVKKERVSISYNLILDREETYYWFMRSYDDAGNTSERSEVFSFTIN